MAAVFCSWLIQSSFLIDLKSFCFLIFLIHFLKTMRQYMFIVKSQTKFLLAPSFFCLLVYFIINFKLLCICFNECISYWQEIDIKNEIIILASTTNTELKDLPKRIPKDSARYHFFLYKHSHEGDYLESIGI